VELEPSNTAFEPVVDQRPHLWSPPPAHLVAISDVNLPAIAGLERQLDSFYAGLLKLEREEHAGNKIIYRAENARLLLNVHEGPPHREDFRPLMVVVPSLGELILRLVETETRFERLAGLSPGSECIVLKDPAGNHVHVSEAVGLI
jgi:hypothetical protein